MKNLMPDTEILGKIGLENETCGKGRVWKETMALQALAIYSNAEVNYMFQQFTFRHNNLPWLNNVKHKLLDKYSTNTHNDKESFTLL